MLGKIRVYNHNNKCYCPKSDRIFTNMDGNLFEMLFEPVRGFAMGKLSHSLFQVEYGTGIFDTSEPPREIFDGDVIQSSYDKTIVHGIRWSKDKAAFIAFHLNYNPYLNDDAGVLTQEWVTKYEKKIIRTIHDGEQNVQNS